MEGIYKVVIAGGRDFNNYALLKTKCDFFLSERIPAFNITILSGHAHGADCLGEQYARERGFQLEIYPAEWDKYGKAAGPIRNGEMAAKADALIAFWDGQSIGTANMINQAKAKGLKVAVVRY